MLSKGIEFDESSFLYGKYRLPDALTNDLANNKEFKSDRERTLSMSHLKRVSRVGGETRVLLCSMFCWESEVGKDVKGRIAEIANGNKNLLQDQQVDL